MNPLISILIRIRRRRKVPPVAATCPVVPFPVPAAPNVNAPASRQTSTYIFGTMQGNTATGTETTFRRDGNTLNAETSHTRVRTADGKYVLPSQVGADCEECGEIIEQDAQFHCDNCSKCLCARHVWLFNTDTEKLRLCAKCHVEASKEFNTWEHKPSAIPKSGSYFNRTGGNKHEPQ
jgi:hypothetical protein